MVRLQDLGKTNGGGGSFFKLEEGQSARVRFLFNQVGDVEQVCYYVHKYNIPGNYATILCSREEGEPIENCKWCSLGNNKVVRGILPLYNEDAQEVQYWTDRSGKFIEETLVSQFVNLPLGAPIAGQVYIITRKGKGMQTTYTVAPDMRTANDNKTKDQFGEVKDAFEINAIKPNDCDYDPQKPVDQAQEPTQATATRRTADVF